MASGEAWKYSAELISACSCDPGCPCNFSRMPTLGYCQGGWALNITNGVYGKTKLDGLKFALFGKWPGQIHEGNGTAGVYIDETATREQRDALVKIVTGKGGGLPWPIFANTFDTWLEPKFVNFEWKFEGVHSSFKAGPYVHAVLEPVRNPVTGLEAKYRLELPMGSIVKEMEIGSSRSFAVMDKGMMYAHPGKYTFVSTVQHSSS